jgi:hypothetical protein
MMVFKGAAAKQILGSLKNVRSLNQAEAGARKDTEIPAPTPRGSLPNSLGYFKAVIRKYGHHTSDCMGYEGETCTCGFEAIFDSCSPSSGSGGT